MGNGQSPPGIDLGTRGTIDDGTLARAESPPPGPIGFDAKGGTAKGSGASLADQIISYARRQRGERVGDGECFTLADRALRSADAKSARRIWDRRSRRRLRLGHVGGPDGATAGRRDSVSRLPLRPRDRHGNIEGDHHARGFQDAPPPHGDRAERGRQRRGHGVGAEQSGGVACDADTVILHRRHHHQREPDDEDHVQGTFWFYRPEAR